MSITVAVNATDGANGPQAAVCQSAAQHNNCGGYNGGGDGDGIGIDGAGIGSVNEDTAVFNRENKDQRHEQVRRVRRSDVVCRFTGRELSVELRPFLSGHRQRLLTSCPCVACRRRTRRLIL